MDEKNDTKLYSTFDYKLIYIFRINDKKHEGSLKIGDATVHTSKSMDELSPNCHELNYAANQRIGEYTSTAGIDYDLLYTELAVKTNDKGEKKAFRDYDVHEVLKRSGIKNRFFDTNKTQNEWFETDLETAKKAIACVKEGRTSLNSNEISIDRNPIVFRPEQEDAIKKTVKRFKTSDHMLWNAKMRFGKTLSALQVIKEMNFQKTIIITHRPVVEDGWYKDFQKIFFNTEYQFGSKIFGEKSIKTLVENGKPFVYFASLQDLRGSSVVGGDFNKNDEIFSIDWDLVIVDEAHEGTQTVLGKKVIDLLKNHNPDRTPKVLDLSGTPFNLLSNFKGEEIYTWDYIMEQEAKQDWASKHFGDSNPYEELPKMNIYTYHLEKSIIGFYDIEDKAFNFKEFFRTWTGDVKSDGRHMPDNAKIGDFVHEDAINSFLNLISKESDSSNYPFSTEEHRNLFKHTLWVLPGVKEAKALSYLLERHPVFNNFKVVNVAGDGDEEIDTTNALEAVRNAIKNNEYTITLSCGRLTTGVTVPEWTAVLMLAGSYSTAASQYLQTIFRVQSPANIEGKMKDNCYVFDFAPDRTLKMIAESVHISATSKSRLNNPINDEVQLGKFLNFCPVVSIDGSQVKEFRVGMLLQELKKAYIERVVKNGFDDTRLYNDELLKLDDMDISEFELLKKNIGNSVPGSRVNNIEINAEGFNNEEYERLEELQQKPKKELSEDEKKELEEIRKKKDNRAKAINILRAISIRMPLLVYGMDVDFDTEINLDTFVNNVDDSSWEEFMPKGVSKDLFKKFTKYYDKNMFIACARRIRSIAKNADNLEPRERVEKIAELFSTFKNPDKETVLTPWRVVNLHMAQTLGGYCFYDKEYEKEIDIPRFVDNGQVTKDTLANPDANIIEINSKTGLYPLYVTYSIYQNKCGDRELSFEEKQKIWDEVVNDNVYVICKTPMAKAITQRTLLGYRNGKINAHAFDDLVNQMKEKQAQLVQKIKSPSFWNKGGVEMKFNAIVGNPPYQNSTGGGQAQGIPVYDKFVLFSIKLKPSYISLIIPSRWYAGGFPALNVMREKICDGNHIVCLNNFYNAQELFSSVDIKGGICYFLYDSSYSGETYFVNHLVNGSVSKSQRALIEDGMNSIIRDNDAISIVDKIKKKGFKSFSEIVSPLWINSTKSSFKSLHSEYSKGDIFAFVLKGKGWISRDELSKGLDFVDKWKLFVPRSIGSADVTRDKIKTIIGEPNTCCSGTYIIIGPFESKEKCENCQSYINTKFFHFLLSLKKVSQDTVKKCYELIPLLEFDHEINDDFLFDLFELNESERNYITKLVWSNIKIK